VTNERDERIAWGLFFVMLGVTQLVPAAPSGSWLVGAGVILLGLCAARLRRRVPIEWFTLGLGLLVMIEGVAEWSGRDVPVLPIVMIVVGMRLLVNARRLRSERGVGAGHRSNPSVRAGSTHAELP
jgi:hypothetical protein